MNKKRIVLISTLLLLTGCSQNLKNNNDTPLKEVSNLETPTSDPYRIQYNEISEEAYVKDIQIIETQQALNDVTFSRYMYTDNANTNYPAGLPIIVKEGSEMTLNVENKTQTDTNIHWHGLSLPNDQDGPGVLVEPKTSFVYNYTPDFSGTYWYHSHNRPVRDQVDFGMYGPLIILNEEDQKYSIDQILVIDDWVVNRSRGHMQVEGDTDTVNGLTGDDIRAIEFDSGDFVKLRLIQAATAKSTVIQFPFEVNVTHTDGMPLATPFKTDRLELAPGERYDVELRYHGDKDEDFLITNERNRGFTIPLRYTHNPEAQSKTVTQNQASPYVIDMSALSNSADMEVEMGSTMRRGNGHEWTLNGEVFPNAETFTFEKDKPYRMKFTNTSSSSNHPMHVHGAHFRVLNVNGNPVTDEVWKDTIDVAPGSYVEVAIQFQNEGEWMMHCHILDHEDGGMMTSLFVES